MRVGHRGFWLIIPDHCIYLGKGHVGSELVSVVAGYPVSELEMEMAIITFFGTAEKYAKSSKNTPVQP